LEYIIPFHLIFTSITEAFYLSIKLSIILSLLYSIPFFYWQFYEFIIVGLYEYEKSELINWKSIVVTLICLIFLIKECLKYLITSGIVNIKIRRKKVWFIKSIKLVNVSVRVRYSDSNCIKKYNIIIIYLW